MLRRPSVRQQLGFAMLELPVVILALLALLGIITGFCLWYRHGHLTSWAWIGFAVAAPFLLLICLIPVVYWLEKWKEKRREKRRKEIRSNSGHQNPKQP